MPAIRAIRSELEIVGMLRAVEDHGVERCEQFSCPDRVHRGDDHVVASHPRRRGDLDAEHVGSHEVAVVPWRDVIGHTRGADLQWPSGQKPVRWHRRALEVRLDGRARRGRRPSYQYRREQRHRCEHQSSPPLHHRAIESRTIAFRIGQMSGLVRKFLVDAGPQRRTADRSRASARSHCPPPHPHWPGRSRGRHALRATSPHRARRGRQECRRRAVGEPGSCGSRRTRDRDRAQDRPAPRRRRLRRARQPHRARRAGPRPRQHGARRRLRRRCCRSAGGAVRDWAGCSRRASGASRSATNVSWRSSRFCPKRRSRSTANGRDAVDGRFGVTDGELRCGRRAVHPPRTAAPRHRAGRRAGCGVARGRDRLTVG